MGAGCDVEVIGLVLDMEDGPAIFDEPFFMFEFGVDKLHFWIILHVRKQYELSIESFCIGLPQSISIPRVLT